MRSFDATKTAALLPMRRVMAALEGVMAEYAAGKVVCPPRLAVPTPGGVLLSMPCSGPELLVHKLLTVVAGNPARGLPAIQGQVTCFEAATGVPLFALDGPAVTARRTAAMSMIGVERLLRRPPDTMLLIGTGAQAAAHVAGALEVHPRLRILVRGRSPAATDAFCRRVDHPALFPAKPGEDADVVVALTSSTAPVYDEAPRPGRLVIGAGAYRMDMVEVGARTIQGSQLYVDDPVGAPAESGDMAAAGVDWAVVRPLAAALTSPPDFARPVFLKTVGCAAWDLAACRAALAGLESVRPDARRGGRGL